MNNQNKIKSKSAAAANLLGRIPLLILPLLFGAPVYALEGGPTMPEYVQFEPADVTDIVNLNTGDFTYSVPLGDVPGPAGNFPLSVSYHAGIGHDQEATWVGLGWTLNPGAINRMLRGYPDDMHNSANLSYIYAHEVRTGWGICLGGGYGPVGLNMTYDSHKGWGGSVSLVALQEGPFSAGVDIGTNGVNPYAQLGIVRADKNGVSATLSMTESAGGLAVSGSIGVHVSWSGHASMTGGVGLSSSAYPYADLVGYSFSSASSEGSVSIGGTGFSSGSSMSGNVRQAFHTSGFGATIPLPNGFWVKFGFDNYEQEMTISDANSLSMYGYMYQGGQAVKIKSIKNLLTSGGLAKVGASASADGNQTNFVWSNFGPSLENLDLLPDNDDPNVGRTYPYTVNLESADSYWMTIPANDLFSAAGPGMSGSFRAFAKNDLMMRQILMKQNRGDKTNIKLNFLNAPVDENDANGWHIQRGWVFNAAKNPQDEDLLFYPETTPGLKKVDYYFCDDGHVPFESARDNPDDVLDFFKSRNGDDNAANDCSPYGFLKSNIINETNRLLISEDDEDRYRVSDHSNMTFGFLNEPGAYDQYRFNDTLYWSYGGRQVIPLLEKEGEEGGRLRGFKIVDMDGKQFFYAKPVYSLVQVDYSTDQAQGMPAFTRDAEDRFSWSVQATPYATQWLLSEVRGADFIKVSDQDMSQNYGYQVKLDYTDPVQYNWRAPYAPPNTPLNQLPNERLGGKDLYIGSMGQKELVYLKSIESATHKAVFNLNDPETEERRDSREWKTPWLGNSSDPNLPPLKMPVTMLFEYKSESFAGESGSDEWEGMFFSTLFDRGFDHYDQSLYTYAVDYECNTIYLPIRPTPSQLDRLKRDGIHLSPYSAAFTYFARPANIDDNMNRYVGPEIHDDAAVNYAVSDIQATQGLEEQWGPYKIILRDPIRKTSAYNDVIPSNEDRSLHRTHLYIGKESFVPYGGTLYRFTGRYRGDFETGSNHVYPIYSIPDMENYPDDYAPIPPQIDLMPLYANNPSRNQARYLKSVDIIKKENDKKIRSFKFTYDNSLCGKTPNSFAAIASATKVYPDLASQLSGKLTLRGITETGYDLSTGDAFDLPGYHFGYQDKGNDFLIGTNPDYFPWTGDFKQKDGDGNVIESYSSDFLNDLSQSDYKSDPWGMFNSGGNSLDQHTVSDGKAVWNLSTITNPLGGELKVEYQRDQVVSQDYDYKDGIKAYAFEGTTGGDGLSVNSSGYITFSPFTRTKFESLWTPLPPPFNIPFLKSSPYFEFLTKADAEERFMFADPSFTGLSAGDSVLVVFKGFSVFEKNLGGTNINAHEYFSATTTLRSVVSDGTIELSLKPADLESIQNIFLDHDDYETYYHDNSGVLTAAVYKKNHLPAFVGDVRVKSLTSCSDNCRTTAYVYEQGTQATRPDSIISNDWIRKNLFFKSDERSFVGDFRDLAKFRLGKNNMPTRADDIDLPFLPTSLVTYGKVTVANLNRNVCDEFRPDIKDCIPSGKIVYQYWTPDDFGSTIFPLGHQYAGDKPGMFNTTTYVASTPLAGVGLIYDDYTSILGRPKSITYYGAQWNGSAAQPRTQFYMVTKDSLDYSFGEGVRENWASQKQLSQTKSFKRVASYFRYPLRLIGQSKYQFIKKVPDEESVENVDHIVATTVNSEFDKLTGTVTKSYVSYPDGLDPTKTKIKETNLGLMSQLGDQSGYSLPKEMKRRNMLTQPYQEQVNVYTKGNRDATIATTGYKLSVWAGANEDDITKGIIYKQGDMVPTFELPKPGAPGELGNPSTFYSAAGYSLSKWTGSMVQKIDQYARPVESQLANGTFASSFYGRNGLNAVGYILNAKNASSKAMTFNPDPASDPDWRYSNNAVYKNGNFSLHRGGSIPMVSKGIPVKNGETYTITLRAKSRSSNANLAVDFFSSYPVIVCPFFSACYTETRTLEGPQQNFSITPTWHDYTATLAVTSSYPIPYASLGFTTNMFNQLRIFNDDASNDGSEYDILIDFIKVEKSSAATQFVQYGDWTLYQANNFLVSNKNAIYSSASGHTSVLQAPLDLNVSGKDKFVVEFRARANLPSIPLQVDFICGSGCEGDQGQVIVDQDWKKYRLLLDRKKYASPSSYGSNLLRFFCDNRDDAEIEIDYARAYPEGALANSFINDDKGNLAEVIDENNVSSYFTYDPFGRLNGMRNDAGFVKSEQAMNYGNK